MFKKLEADPKRREEAVLALWEKVRAFEQSVEKREGCPRFVFYEGPPTANGRPHFAHLLARVYKDLFPRYKTMRGYCVPRKAGWDCHGLPVELEVEKELGVSTKAEIERFGVEKFVEACRASVNRYIREWEKMLVRMGFWIDLAHPYVTYTDEYIETLWWELREMYKKGFLYKGHKILPYCPRCGTPLSSHEVALGYRRVADPSVFVRMPLSDDPAVSLLVWTTTPWTLPANVAVAVAAAAAYVEVLFRGERLILAKPRLPAVLGEEATVLREFLGQELVGRTYQPLYPLAQNGAYRVVADEFVSMEEGTGIVHIAPAFGEEDHALGKREGLPLVQPVDRTGRFTSDFPLCAGLFVKDADARIIEDLRARGRLFHAGTYEHEYPFCWRCDTPLLYYALDSWFIATTKAKDKIIAENAKIVWHPEHAGTGRFLDFLQSMRDWALSRERYWGTPLPVWTCPTCGAQEVVGSRAELVEKAIDKELARAVELHRPYVDRVELRCRCGGRMRREPYVLDTWFDSGSMHTAQWHFPFENVEEFKSSYPADFICEGLDQTRGWFYTLLVTGVLVHGAAPYRRVLVTGLGLDAQGQKMSKSRGNVIDPLPLADEHGADAIRWYLLAESAPWTERRLSPEGVKEARFGFLETVRNCHDFFALYAAIDGFDPKADFVPWGERPALDRWLGSRLSQAVEQVTRALDSYDVVKAAREIEDFVDDLSNWYIRASRPRFWGAGLGRDKLSAYHTLYTALKVLSLLLAPFTPFLAEAMWQNLREEEDEPSVHLADWPEPLFRDEELEEQMRRVRQVVELALAARNRAKIKVRQPLRALFVLEKPGDREIPQELWALAKEELNVFDLQLVSDLSLFRVPRVSPDFRKLGPRLGSLAQAAGQKLREAPSEWIRTLLEQGRAVLDLPNASVEIRSDEVQITWEPKEGFVLEEDVGGAVALDVQLDEELQVLGDLRELVHRIQLLRKEAGFEVTDRILVGYAGELGRIFRRFPQKIQEEVLARGLVEGEIPDAEYTAELEVHGKRGRVWLRRWR
ncbi:MAG: isoleucine--tRNA ligase [Candidatus Bipolaricaulota bacterium]|nr:isoleucine--tRNA ligase [Candidatus Bipolaricaulota bacterium]MDW8126615.1 isoleucine--tRNA ligase [Candidatus Bipolaricaulota bacterium]